MKPLNFTQIKTIYLWVLNCGDRISIENGQPYLTDDGGKYLIEKDGIGTMV